MRRSPRLTEGDIAAIITDPLREDRDAEGRVRFTARVGGEFLRLVIVIEDPDLIVSVPRRRSP